MTVGFRFGVSGAQAQGVPEKAAPFLNVHIFSGSNDRQLLPSDMPSVGNERILPFAGC
jgi:hypothetical protein